MPNGIAASCARSRCSRSSTGRIKIKQLPQIHFPWASGVRVSIEGQCAFRRDFKFSECWGFELRCLSTRVAICSLSRPTDPNTNKVETNQSSPKVGSRSHSLVRIRKIRVDFLLPWTRCPLNLRDIQQWVVPGFRQTFPRPRNPFLNLVSAIHASLLRRWNGWPIMPSPLSCGPFFASHWSPLT